MKIINDLFEFWYWLLAAALVIGVPIWFAGFTAEAVRILLRRDRATGRRGSPRAPSGLRR